MCSTVLHGSSEKQKQRFRQGQKYIENWKLRIRNLIFYLFIFAQGVKTPVEGFEKGSDMGQRQIKMLSAMLSE